MKIKIEVSLLCQFSRISLNTLKRKYANLKYTGNFSGLKKHHDDNIDLTQHRGGENYNKSNESESLKQFQKGIHSGQLQRMELNGIIKCFSCKMFNQLSLSVILKQNCKSYLIFFERKYYNNIV